MPYLTGPLFFFFFSLFVILFLAFVVLERIAMKNYFTEYTFAKSAFYAVTLVFVLSMCAVVLFEIVLTDEQICNEASWSTTYKQQQMMLTELKYKNPSYTYRPCHHIRLPALLFLTREECSHGRHLLWSVFLGGIIGWERREADRPAGIRTMSLVSLGACLFSINSAFAFIDGPMSWDSSRVSAAIPSGVGFLGAGLIFKEADKDKVTGDTTHVVHGLTTAASVWMSAAVGVACAGRLYFSAAFTVALILVVLRFGPRQQDMEEDYESSVPMTNTMNYRGHSVGTEISAGAPNPQHSATLSDGVDPERRSLVGFSVPVSVADDGNDDHPSLREQAVGMRASMRRRAALGDIV